MVNKTKHKGSQVKSKTVSERALEDFHIYGQGVKRLHELKKELDSLDTRKFRRDAKKIRRKLNKVHLIPEIEHDLKKLKAKILGIDVEYEKDKIDLKQSQKIRGLERKQQESAKIPYVLGKVRGINKEIEKVENKKLRKQLSKQEIKQVKSLPRLRTRISYLKQLLNKQEKELEKEINKAKTRTLRKQLSKKEVKDVHAIPNLKGKIHYLKELHDKDSEQLVKLEDLEVKVGRALRVAYKKQLNKIQLKNIDNIPSLQGKISYLKQVIGKESEQIAKLEENIEKALVIERERLPILSSRISVLKRLFTMEKQTLEQGRKNQEKEQEEIEKLENKVSRALSAAYRKQLNKHQLKDIENISTLRGRISYLKQALGKGTERINKLQHDLNKSFEKIEQNKLSKQELEDLKEISKLKQELGLEKQKIPQLSSRISSLRGSFIREREEREKGQEEIEKEQEKLEKRTENIPFLQRKLTHLSEVINERTKDEVKEHEDIKELKNRIYYLKKELEKRAIELEKELNEKTKLPSKKEILSSIKGLNEKINQSKLELNKNITLALSEARWSVEKEKQDIRQELGDILSESRWLIEKEAQEINEQLLEEVKKLNFKFEKDKVELQKNLQDKLVNLNTQVQELQTQKKEMQEQMQRKLKEEKEKQEKELLEKQKKIERDSNPIKILPQPFSPPPKFETMKVRALKGQEDIFDRLRKQITEIKNNQESKHYSLNDFDEDDSPLPKIEESFNKRFDFPEITKEDLDKINHFSNPIMTHAPAPFIKLSSPAIIPNKQENLEPKFTHHLPVIPKQEFLEDLEKANQEQQKIQNSKKQTQEKYTQEIQRRATRTLFLEVKEFKQAENDLKNINDIAGNFEKEIKSSILEKSKEQKEMQDLIKETQELSLKINKIDNLVLKRIQQQY